MFDNAFDEGDDEEPFFMPGDRGFAEIVRDALSILPQICLDCCPGGTFYCGEYMTNHPDYEDDEHSLCINLQTGRWTDIAAKAQGFEAVTYYAHITGLPLDDALKMLAKYLETHFGR